MFSLGALSELDFQAKAYPYQDYQAGNPNHGHIMEMMDIRSVVRAQENITGRRLMRVIL
jgi:hypothetical protein